jgi:hypothetical protein
VCSSKIVNKNIVFLTRRAMPRPKLKPTKRIRRGKELLVDPQIMTWRRKRKKAEKAAKEAIRRTTLGYKPLFE